jgi:aminoglycoside 6'-N-acetyltransferase I
MPVRLANTTDIAAWAELRADLWPQETVAQHRDEIASLLAGDGFAAFVAVTDTGGIAGFAEAALRRDYVNGCETSPVVFLEGIQVRADYRRTDVGRALCAAVEAWGRSRGCAELASDALLENTGSHAFHRAVGFEETVRVVCFRKFL